MKVLKNIALAIVAVSVLGGCSTGGASSEDSSNAAKKEKPSEISVYFTRHGKTMLNTSGRMQGWCDAPLTPAGVEVAEAVGEGIGDKIEFDKAYSSDSGRAIETAEIILDKAGQDIEVNQDKRLREFNFGTYEGSMSEETQALIAESNGMTLKEAHANLAVDGHIKYIKGTSDDLAEMDKKNVKENENWPAEDFESVSKRSVEAMNDIVAEAEKNGDDSILIVSHGMTLVTLLSELDPSIVDDIPLEGLENSSISKAIYKEGKWKVETINDKSYVKE